MAGEKASMTSGGGSVEVNDVIMKLKVGWCAGSPRVESAWYQRLKLKNVMNSFHTLLSII